MKKYAHIALALAAVPVVSSAQTLEASIVTDWETVQVYGSVEETRRRIDAAVVYADAILDEYLGVNIKVTHVEIPESESEDTIANHTHVNFLLESLYEHRKNNPDHYYADTTVMFTKRDLMKGTKNLGGVAYIGSICSTKSLSITELHDNGLDGETLAHELAHVLGAYHDGEPPCESVPSYGYIMSPTLHSGNSHFSQCSIDTIKSFINAHGGCMFEDNTGIAPVDPNTNDLSGGGGGSIDILFLLMLLIAVIPAQSTRTELNA